MDERTDQCLVRLVLAFRKADTRLVARRILAKTITDIVAFGLPDDQKIHEEFLGQFLPKSLADALIQVEFNFDWAKNVDLVHSQNTYREIEDALAVCFYIANADAELISQFMRIVDTPVRREAWNFIQKLSAKELGAISKQFEETTTIIAQNQRISVIQTLNPPTEGGES